MAWENMFLCMVICSEKICFQTASPCHIMPHNFVAKQHHLLHAGGATKRCACYEAGTAGRITDMIIYVCLTIYLSIYIYLYLYLNQYITPIYCVVTKTFGCCMTAESENMGGYKFNIFTSNLSIYIYMYTYPRFCLV